MLLDMEKLRSAMQARLTPARYAHSLAVRKQAMLLAGRFEYDWYKAGIAGLVHDVCKCMDLDAQLNYLSACGILLDDFTLAHPGVWHAISGAVYAERTLGIDDPEILDAIRYHTTGRANMSLGEKILYVADLSSEDRVFPDVARVRELAEDSLDAAIGYCQRYMAKKVILAGQPLLQDAWEAYNFYGADRS